MNVCVTGGGAALARPVIRRHLLRGNRVTALCRESAPDADDRLLTAVRGVDLAGERAFVGEAMPRSIDLLIHLAGGNDDAKLADMTRAQWEDVIRDNLTSAFNVLAAGLPRMVGPSNVVVVGSVVAARGGRGCANYAAAKAGLEGLVRAAAEENAGRGVVINLLRLGYVDVGMGASLPPHLVDRIKAAIPLGRFASDEEAADAIDFLSTVRYMTGDVLNFAGGMR
jgi:3-oxoacyl-[acyl-carrier protein] reductase